MYRTSVERWRRYEPWLGELRELLNDDDADAGRQPISDNAQIAAARRLREFRPARRGAVRVEGGAAEIALRSDPLQRCRRRLPVIQSGGTRTRLLRAGDRPLPEFRHSALQSRRGTGTAGTPHEAVSALRRAIALSPTLGQAYSRLGNLLQTRASTTEAMECFRHAKRTA